MLTFETLSETSELATKWVPFCKKYSIEPGAPEWYFSKKIDYLKNRVHPEFARERRAMKREYEEFKVRINGLVSIATKVPGEGWTMHDGTPWPGNIVCNHTGMIQIDVLASLLSGRLVRERIGLTMLSVVQSQMEAVETSFEDVHNIFDISGAYKGLAGDSVEKIPTIRITRDHNEGSFAQLKLWQSA